MSTQSKPLSGVVRVAVVQAGSVLFDTPATLAKLRCLAREAAGKGARLALFPEAFVGGYPKGLDFGVKLGSRTPEGRDWFRRYSDAAIAVPGPETAEIGAVAAEHAIEIVTGVVERAGSTLYCAVLHFDALGRLVNRRRKLMPTALERVVWGQGDGSTLAVAETEVGRTAYAICWENMMPLLRTALYAQDVQLWCAPTVDDRETWQASMRHIAMEGRCFVLSAVQHLTRADCPADYPAIEGLAPDAPLVGGGSLIVGPLGAVIAGPERGGEAVLTADLDLADLTRARYDFDAVGHYARPDVFSLQVDTRAKAPVERIDLAGQDFPIRP
ncbi:MAG TPA: nitrilase-related carbon-nitrogen hydrolase [Caulobacteraceae bacterium]|jgi:nitrilase|nr:nitrilase-related carbon-nitrogen hydrolase [Caulobacteraceae bacterium]